MTRSDWDALSARERDAVVAEKVMGLAPSVLENLRYSTNGKRLRLRTYTTSWDAMREVVERMLEELAKWEQFDISKNWDKPGWRAAFGSWGHGKRIEAFAPTAPEAVAIAALTALGHMEG